MKLRWDSIVDLVTIVWLFFFALGLIRPDLGDLCDGVNLALLPVFVADLVFKYKGVKSLKTFLKYHWFDVLITIPYFRFLRALRILRVSRIVGTARAARMAREMLRFTRAFKKLKSILKGVVKRQTLRSC